MTEPLSKKAIYTVFAGLMLGMLVASLNMTLVAPAMPTIVAELGGVEHYSWIPISALIASTVVVPIVGKLSDIYGRKSFYMAGIVIFSLGSTLAGLAPSFWFLIAARVVQGIGMGTVQPLSQAIIGDLVTPRERGKYQGLIGATFGLAAIMGPPLGGFITDHFSWRVLFFANIPVALATLAVIGFFMHIPRKRRRASIDVGGIITLTGALGSGLFATLSINTEFAWGSWQIDALYAISAGLLAAFIWIELRVREPVIPLQLWRSSLFVFSNIANMTVAMAMFGAIYFLPVFIQGVLGETAGGSGSALVPMLLAMVAVNIVNGQLMSRTGRYKPQVLAGIAIMGLGYWLLARMDLHTDHVTVVRNMVLVGFGLGVGMQTYTLIIQNSVPPQVMGVATSASQLFRSMGGAIGLAVMGSVLTQSLTAQIPRHLPPDLRSGQPINAGAAGSVLDPAALTQLPPALAGAIRAALGDALHVTFLTALLMVAIAFVASLLIPELPLRRTHAPAVEEAGKEVLVELGTAGPAAEPVLGPRSVRT